MCRACRTCKDCKASRFYRTWTRNRNDFVRFGLHVFEVMEKNMKRTVQLMA